jgi:iron complex transport system substrate-binding protein
MSRPHLVVALALLAATSLGRDGAGATAHAQSPVVVENCGVTASIARPPARVVTLNQAATEVMLVLGLQSCLVGTAYLDDQILPEVADAYRRIPVLAAKYPSREILLAAKPDFLYATYPGAYGPGGIGSRADWKTRGVETYLSPAGCTDKTRPPGVTIETTFAEIREVARMFGVGERGDRLVDSYQRELQTVRGRIGTVARSPRVFWYDAGDPPQAGACCGAPNEILRMAGAANIFADTPGSWTPVSWEAVIARNPDVIVLANASWSTAAQKRAQLMGRKALSTVDAIKQNRIIEIDFAYTTPGIRNVAAVRKLAEALYPDRFR